MPVKHFQNASSSISCLPPNKTQRLFLCYQKHRITMNVVGSAGKVVISKQQTNEQIQSQQPN
ncbi:hypothetical protein NQZ68_039585 [Dissostichus eleginoides]|nr:hypothetical protein NQZ68_039585 [Dissostichus eleginoides]